MRACETCGLPSPGCGHRAAAGEILATAGRYQLAVSPDSMHPGMFVGKILSDGDAILEQRGYDTPVEAAYRAMVDFSGSHRNEAEALDRDFMSRRESSEDASGALASERRSLPAAPHGSAIAYALFRREDGWQPGKAARWLGIPYDDMHFEEMESAGGERLDPGNYILVRVAPTRERFDRYAYSEELPNHRGVWLKFGFHGKRTRGREDVRATGGYAHMTGYHLQFLPYLTDEYPAFSGSVDEQVGSERDAVARVIDLAHRGLVEDAQLVHYPGGHRVPLVVDGRFTRDFMDMKRAAGLPEPKQAREDGGMYGRRWTPEPLSKEFVRSYLQTAIWSSNDDKGNRLDRNHDTSDFAAEAIVEAIKDANAFIEGNRVDLIATGASDEQNGHDFWLTRNRSGEGFWSRGYGDVGRKLTDAAHEYGEADVYVGDDGKLYLS